MKNMIFPLLFLALMTQTGWTQSSIQLGEWNSTTSFNMPRSAHTSVAYQGYLYVIGGQAFDGNTRYSDVQYAPINSDGSLGMWRNATPLDIGRRSHTSVVHNGFLYVIGGTPSGGGMLDRVQYAQINADGSLGPWKITTPFETGRLCHTSIVNNGFLYILQGFYTSALFPLTDVQYAQFNNDGSLGHWQYTNSFYPERWNHSSIAYNGRIYSMGGANWYGSYYTLDDTQYSSFNSDGSLNNWNITKSLVDSLAAFGLVEYNGKIIITGGANIPSGNMNDVKYTAIQSAGSLGTWQTLTPFNIARNSHASVVYNGYIYVIGGGNNEGVLNDVQYAKILPGEGPIFLITINKSNYVNGDAVTATEFRLQNLGFTDEQIELKVWLGIPGIAPIGILNLGADGSFIVPNGLNLNFGTIKLFTVSSDLPRGGYELSSHMINPVTGSTISEDLNPFTLQ
jgi:hypothetical protein